MQWTIRNLLNPVITRCLIYGINPFDLEYVLRKMEEKPLLNARMLDETWMTEWGEKADRFIQFAQEAKEKKNLLSVSEYYAMTSKCYYACYLLNSDRVENKKEIYKKLAFTYRESLMNSKRKVEELKIAFGKRTFLPAYLHLPNSQEFHAPYPCVIIFTGMGSCKEEMEIEAKTLVDRGIAALTVDMPGVGEALFQYELKMSVKQIEEAFEVIIEFCKTHPFIDATRLGTYGLCMGGGYAYRAAAKFATIKCCVTLFPLILSMVDEKSIPRWMKQGKWAEYQMGQQEAEELIRDMAIIEEGQLSCRYLLVHSTYDNWMELSKTKRLFANVVGEKVEIEIEEQPIYATEESVMHAMPVGEQMHWIKRKAADFFKDSFYC